MLRAYKPPDGSLSLPGWHVWDSCVVEHESTLFRYALCADAKWSIEERHDHALLRLATSADGGKNWKDEGNVITPFNDGSWPNHVIWTSHGTLRQKHDKVEVVLMITGRSIEDGWTQKIGIATSDDGKQFSKPILILDPADPACVACGYDVTEINPQRGVIMAWRDPFLFLDPRDGTWHLFFAAKPDEPRPSGPIGTVGHAIAVGDDLEKWILTPPLTLPQYYHQLEVPSMIYRDGEYFLFVSTQNNPLMDSNAGKESAFRAYRASSIDGPWCAVYGRTDRVLCGTVYAPLLFTRESGAVAAVAFYPDDSPWPICGTPIAPLTWEDGMPFLTFPS